MLHWKLLIVAASAAAALALGFSAQAASLQALLGGALS